jgi:hypothetical protein
VKSFLTVFSAGICMVTTTIAWAGEKSPQLIHTESVAQVTPAGSDIFGPVGPDCDATAGGPGCTFDSGDFTTTSETVPLGRSTGKGHFTILFGPNGEFVTPSGAHDDSGNPIGFCAPEFSTETDTYGDGSSITQSFQGTICGPPNTTHFTSIITGGTGGLASATGGSSGSVDEPGSGLPNLDHFEGVLQLPSGSD